MTTTFEFSRMKLIAAVMLASLIFAAGTSAQKSTDPILDEDGLASLLTELKEGLTEFIADEGKITAIAEKWDAREDLAEKNRYGVIRLLIEDVRAIITDQKLSLKIWHKWNGVAEEPEIIAKPEPVRKPDSWIKIIHAGAYIAHFDVTWDEPDRPNRSWNGGGKTAGWMDLVYIPAAATNIRLRMRNDTGLVWQPQREILNKVLQPSDLNKCYRVTGTTLGSSYDNDCQ
ncbi:MAG: hypothetical protein IPI64_08495 [Chloracidobacterium sp.]|nr:hypothetical protein [Chloracidobacterium sp.]